MAGKRGTLSERLHKTRRAQPGRLRAGIGGGLCDRIAAAEAFTDAFGLAILIGAAVTLLGALVVARVMPARQEPLPEAKPQEVEEVEAPPVPLPEPAPEPAAV